MYKTLDVKEYLVKAKAPPPSLPPAFSCLELSVERGESCQLEDDVEGLGGKLRAPMPRASQPVEAGRHNRKLQ